MNLSSRSLLLLLCLSETTDYSLNVSFGRFGRLMNRRRRISAWVLAAGAAVALLLVGVASVESHRDSVRLSQLRDACEHGPIDWTNPVHPRPRPFGETWTLGIPAPKLAPPVTAAPERAIPEGFKPYEPPPDPEKTESIVAACDPTGSLFDPSTEPMKLIRDVYVEKEFWDDLPWPASPLIVIVFSIPWLWYFLLARVQN